MPLKSRNLYFKHIFLIWFGQAFLNSYFLYFSIWFLLIDPWILWMCTLLHCSAPFAADSASPDCPCAHRKQEALVAMAQPQCYVRTNIAWWHLAASVCCCLDRARQCADARACFQRPCTPSCSLNAPLPPSVCLLADGRMICTGGSWEISCGGLIKCSTHEAGCLLKPLHR